MAAAAAVPRDLQAGRVKSPVSEQSNLISTLAAVLQKGGRLVTDEKCTNGQMRKVYLLTPPNEWEANGEILVLPAVPHDLLHSLQDNIKQDGFQKIFDIRAAYPHDVGDDSLGESAKNRFWYTFKCDGVHVNNDFYGQKSNNERGIMYARALNHSRPEHCPLLTSYSKLALANLEYMVNQLLLGVFPEMAKELEAEKARCKRDNLPPPAVGIERDKLSWTKDELDNDLCLLEKVGKQFTGYMTKGHHGFVEGVFGLFQTKEQDPQPLHTDCRLAAQRAKDLKEKGTLSKHSYRVGYVLVVPLSLEGARLDYVVQRTETQKEVVQCHICFGAAMLIRMDIYHAGGYGSKDNWRLLAAFLTPKSAYFDGGDYLDMANITNEAGIANTIIYRGQTTNTPTLSPMYEFLGHDACTKALGKGSRNDESLLKAYLNRYPGNPSQSLILKFVGHDGLWDPKEIKRLTGIPLTKQVGKFDVIMCLMRKRHMNRRGKSSKQLTETEIEEERKLLLKQRYFDDESYDTYQQKLRAFRYPLKVLGAARSLGHNLALDCPQFRVSNPAGVKKRLKKSTATTKQIGMRCPKRQRRSSGKNLSQQSTQEKQNTEDKEKQDDESTEEEQSEKDKEVAKSKEGGGSNSADSDDNSSSEEEEDSEE